MVKIIRAYVIKYLTNKYINYLLNEQFLNNDDINLRDREILINTNWDRRTGSIKRLIEIFALDENYLPKEPLNSLSKITTSCDFLIEFTKLYPMNPAPPVIKILDNSYASVNYGFIFFKYFFIKQSPTVNKDAWC